MLGKIVLTLVMLLIASFVGLLACAFDSTDSPKSGDEISVSVEDPTTLSGCLSMIFFLAFGALLLLGLMWFVYGFLGAEPSATSQLPWALKRG